MRLFSILALTATLAVLSGCGQTVCTDRIDYSRNACYVPDYDYGGYETSSYVTTRPAEILTAAPVAEAVETPAEPVMASVDVKAVSADEFGVFPDPEPEPARTTGTMLACDPCAGF